jgi:hypothetical protein
MVKLRNLFFFAALSAVCFEAAAQTVEQPSPRKTNPLPTIAVPRWEPMGPTSRPGSSVLDTRAAKRVILQKYTNAIYRKPTLQELLAIAPDQAVAEKYNAFLQSPKTGIIKFVPDAGCDADTRLVDASETCRKYSMPGGGSSYSFRTGEYRISRLADITFSGDRLIASGVLTHGMLVSLGSVPLEDVSLSHPALRYLIDFQPAVNFEIAKTNDVLLIAGVRRDGFLYRRALPARENSTYVLRQIAYEGRVLRSAMGVTYNELDYDRRRDIIVALRIVASDKDGAITVLWKELSTHDAPRLKDGRGSSAARSKLVAQRIYEDQR